MKTPEQFMEYFRTNYPGPNTIIRTPDWHAPKIYRAAIDASAYGDLLEACKALQMEAAARHCGLKIADDAIKKAEGGE